MNYSPEQKDIVNSDRIIYTPSDFAKSNLLYLQEAGSLKAMLAHKNERENLHSLLFFIVTDGDGSLFSDGKTYSLRAGDCAFIDCTKKYFHSTSLNLWSLKWVHFYGPNAAAIYEKYAERGGKQVFRPESCTEFETLIDKIIFTARSDDYVKDMHIFEQLSSLCTRLIELSRYDCGDARTGFKKYNLQEIKDCIDLEYREKITLDKLSQRFFINKFYLARIFKAQFGMSVNSYLTDVRITHAKQLLRFSDMSVEQVGHSCGMSDANYFSRVFRKVEGCSPAEFRRRWGI
jgi:AraC-like DNA-binding protein